jgi:hypothetical protein
LDSIFINYSGPSRRSREFTDFYFRPLASLTHRDDIHPVLLAEGVNRWRLLAEWDAAPAGPASSAEPPGASGDTARPNYVGPSGNGLVERMKAGESPRDQGLSVKGAPVRFQKAVPRTKEKRRSGAPKGAPARVMGRQSRPLTGWVLPQGRPTGAAFRAREFRRSATLTWRGEGFETDNLERQSAGMRRAATLPHGSTHARRHHDAPIKADHLRSTALGRCGGPCRLRWCQGRTAFWQNEPEDFVLAKRTRDVEQFQWGFHRRFALNLHTVLAMRLTNAIK